MVPTARENFLSNGPRTPFFWQKEKRFRAITNQLVTPPNHSLIAMISIVAKAVFPLSVTTSFTCRHMSTSALPSLPSVLSKATADLYDQFLDQARVPLDISWQSYGNKSHFAGPIVSIKCFEDNSRIKECAESPGNGRVMVVDAGGSRRCAVLGDMIAEQARDNGWRGIIVNGCVRDVAVLRSLENFGVMALGSLPRKSTRRGEGQVDLPIRLGNVEVQTGDYVVADDDGLLFLTADQVGQSDK